MSIPTACLTSSSSALSHGFPPNNTYHYHPSPSSSKLLKLSKRSPPQASSSSSPSSSTSSSKKEEEDQEDKEKGKSEKKSSSSSSLEADRGGNIKGFGTNLSTTKSSSKDKGKQKSSPKPNPNSNLNPNTTSRRASPAKPLVAPSLNPEDQQIENAFVLSLTSIGFLIFMEGIALAASGLLPEEWDAVITKFVYPSFTPTVGLFLAGAVFYGVYKLLQARDPENK